MEGMVQRRPLVVDAVEALQPLSDDQKVIEPGGCRVPEA
jgi:hypothetical protein